MFIKFIECLAYSGSIAALLASLIAIFTMVFLDADINFILLALIFSGTISVYNIDHFRDLDKDNETNPKRVKFIKDNKIPFTTLTILSLLISCSAIYLTGFKILYFIIPPFLLGLLHRRLKKSPIAAAIYITLSWLTITVILPAFIANKLPEVIIFSSIIGTILFFNAYASSLRYKYYAIKYVRYMLYLSLLVLIIIIGLRGLYLGIIPLAFFTSMALTNYMEDEDYEVIFFDGLQLSGTILSILFLLLIKL